MSVEFPAATIIVCTSNRAQYLPECLESLARQDCNMPFEIIVVDNASTDDTPAILAAWRLRDLRFRIAREPRIGLSVAKNTGVRLARGRLLLFTDDDVLVDPGWVRSYVDFFKGHGDDPIVAGGPIVPVPHDLGRWPAWFDECALPDLALLDYSEERPLGRYEYVWGANMAVPAELFRRFGAWDESVGRRGEARGTYEDSEYQDRVRAAGGAVWFRPAARLRHRVERRDITPAKILRTAYTRGRNRFWRDLLDQRSGEEAAARRDYVSGLSLWLARLSILAFWTLILQCFQKPAVFARAHRAAWSSGWTMDILRAGRESSRLSVTVGSASIFVLDSVLRLTARGK